MPTSPVIVRTAIATLSVVALAGCGGASHSTTSPPAKAATQSSTPPPPRTPTAALLQNVTSIPTGDTVTAAGHGQVEGTPDLLTVTLGVQTSGPKLQSALATNNQEAQSVISKLQADGVQAKDLQTSQLSINPLYTQPGPNVAPKLSGYQVSDIVTANIRELARGGTIIDDAVAAGGSDAQIQGIAYSVENPGPLHASAHAVAVKQAELEARAMAAAAGRTLGPVKALNDLAQPQYQCCVGSAASGSTAGGAVSFPQAPPPLQPGSEVISADVSVVYALS